MTTKVVSQCISADYCKGWNDAVQEINKYEWHNLLKDPTDLPDVNKQVLVMRDNGLCDTDWLYPYHNNKIQWVRTPKNLAVAWAYIKPYEVKE